MKKEKTKKTTGSGDIMLPDLRDAEIRILAKRALDSGMPNAATALRAYICLRASVTKARNTPNDQRNCDVMTTAAALRKGWERRCEYGTPCCPFEYAMEPFYGEDRK